MKQKSLSFIPSALETWGILFVSLLVMLLGNGHDLLERYGLISSSRVVHDQLSQGVGHGLQKLDSFTITRSAVTFGVWAVVGLISFSLFQALYSASQRLKYEQAVSSNEYVHPSTFNRGNYWRRIVLDTVVSLVLLVLLVSGLIVYLFVALPPAIRRTERFLLHVSLGNLASFGIGLAILLIGTYLLYVLAKLVAWHRRATKR